ncbi:MAG: RNA polymerase sigma factor [candidate division Zixibacteria bacterium]|nr:RNA polymerase sigma factor [candidate division Zixibacteria bacterium]MCI0595274.1 RNA polymerase sigma factor [candidate division Zixibacteria bacterium]
MLKDDGLEPRKEEEGPNGRFAKSAGEFSEDPQVLALIARVKEKDEAAFKELVERYKTQVAGLAFKMVGDYEDAKDISQIVFVKTFYNLKSFDPKKKFSTWLFRITVNAAIDYWRRYKKHKHEDLEEAEGSPLGVGLSPEAVYFRKDATERIKKALEVLSPKQRSIFVLRDMEGLDITEVATIMNIPQVTVRWYLHRARVKLRSELARRLKAAGAKKKA